MIKYYIGVDIATGSDYTSYCVTKRTNWFERNILRRDYRKVIYFGDDERAARKYIRKPNAMTYLDGPEAKQQVSDLVVKSHEPTQTHTKSAPSDPKRKANT